MAKKNEKNDWIKVAFKLLREKCIHEVRVESIARELNVTKGGFYGYFLNRDALLQSMLDHWESTLTDQIISKVSKIEGPLKDQLTGILSLVYKHVDEDIDKAMTAWSYKDQRARVVVNRVVRRRIDYMKGLFENAGFTSEQAELRARLMHSFVHGDRSFPEACEPRKSADRETIIQAFIELVCSPIES